MTLTRKALSQTMVKYMCINSKNIQSLQQSKRVSYILDDESSLSKKTKPKGVHTKRQINVLETMLKGFVLKRGELLLTLQASHVRA